MKVIFSRDVIIYLTEIIKVLYMGDYFGFQESAIKYVDELAKDIETTIDKKQKKEAPPYFCKYGKSLYYVSYRKNKNTQWYVFFNLEDNIYYIRYIGNNHICAQYL